MGEVTKAKPGNEMRMKRIEEKDECGDEREFKAVYGNER